MKNVYFNPLFNVIPFDCRLGYLDTHAEFNPDPNILTIQFSLNRSNFGPTQEICDMIFKINNCITIKPYCYKLIKDAHYSKTCNFNNTDYTFTEKISDGSSDYIAVEFKFVPGKEYIYNNNLLDAWKTEGINITAHKGKDCKKASDIFIGTSDHIAYKKNVTKNDFYGDSDKSYKIDSRGYVEDTNHHNISTYPFYPSKKNDGSDGHKCDSVDITFYMNKYENYNFTVHCFDINGNWIGIASPSKIAQCADNLIKVTYNCISSNDGVSITDRVKFTITAKNNGEILTNSKYNDMIFTVRINEKKVATINCTIPSSWDRGYINWFNGQLVSTPSEEGGNNHWEVSDYIYIDEGYKPIIRINNSSGDIESIVIYTDSIYNSFIYDIQLVAIEDNGIFEIIPRLYDKNTMYEIRIAVCFSSTSNLTGPDLVTKNILKVLGSHDVGVSKKVLKMYVGDSNGKSRLVYNKRRIPSIAMDNDGNPITFNLRQHDMEHYGYGETKNYMVFLGGYNYKDKDLCNAYAYDKNLTEINIDPNNILGSTREQVKCNFCSSQNTDGSAIVFAGYQWYRDNSMTWTITPNGACSGDAYVYEDGDLTISKISSISDNRCPSGIDNAGRRSAFFNGNYIFAGGYKYTSDPFFIYSKKVEMYREGDYTLTKIEDLDAPRETKCVTTKNYCWFTPGQANDTDNGNSNYLYSSVVRMAKDFTMEHVGGSIYNNTTVACSTKDYLIVGGSSRTTTAGTTSEISYSYNFYAISEEGTQTNIKPYPGNNIYLEGVSYSNAGDYVLTIGGGDGISHDINGAWNNNDMKIINNDLTYTIIQNDIFTQKLSSCTAINNTLYVIGKESNFKINI